MAARYYTIDDTFFRRFQHVIEMLVARNYNVGTVEVGSNILDLPTLSISSFKSYFLGLEKIDLKVYHTTDNAFTMRIVFVVPGAASKTEKEEDRQILGQQIDALTVDLDKSPDVQRLLILSNHKLAPQASADIQNKNLTPQVDVNITKAQYYIEFFQMHFFDANIIKHRLQPKYRVLSEQEVNNMLKQLAVDPQISDKKLVLPRTVVTDSSSRYYGLRRGDVVLILVKIPTKTIYLRYCVLEYEAT